MSMGEGLGMDPEIAALFLGARDNNKNVSGLLNNIDSSVLALLAGVYDPLSAQGRSGGQLWSSYAGNPDYPVVQDIQQKIQGGADPYYLNSYIDGLVANKVDLNGFQDADLKGLAKGLYNEYNGKGSGSGGGSGGGDDDLPSWLRDPTDVYTTQDLPMTPKLKEMISELRKNDATYKAESFKKGKESIIAKRKLGPLYGKDFSDDIASKVNELKKEIPSLRSTGYGPDDEGEYIEGASKRLENEALVKWLKETPEGKKLAKEKKINWKKVDAKSGKVYGWAPSRKKGSWWNPLNWDENVVSSASRAVESVVKGGDVTNIRDVVGYKATPDAGLETDYLQKKKSYQDVKGSQQRIDMLEQAYREGALAYLEGQGRTPTRDQLSGMLKFIKNT
jgi:hypothetical protein